MKTTNTLRHAALTGLMFLASAASAVAQDYIYVYKDGVIRYRDEVQNVDSVALSQDKTEISLFNTNHQKVYSSARTEVDSISKVTSVPQADLLDISFLSDGTAVDISPRHMKVQKVGSTQKVYYSDVYKRNVASFSNTWAGSASGYYKVDYESNSSFRRALSDGHTLECLLMASYSGTIGNAEAKPFSSHQAGGTGFLISTIDGARQNEITFLPNVSTSGSSTWRWATSHVVPRSKVFYHVVGVWDRTAKKAHVYVNGELCNTVDASGSLVFPSTGSRWFGIGCDPDGSNGNNGWSGDIAMARIYDDPLTAEQVAQLWQQVSILQSQVAPDMVTDVDFISNLPFRVGGTYPIAGKGFQQGDLVELLSADGTPIATVPAAMTAAGITISIPEGITTGDITLVLHRGQEKQMLGSVTMRLSERIPAGTRVIAHRGHWGLQGSAQNSRSSLTNAFSQKCFGSETDVWITTDGHIMVNHDASFSGTTIETSSYASCKNLTLSNGEKMPELKDFLDMLEAEDSTKLIIEIKTHASETRGKACVEEVVKQVRERGLQDKVEYIAFSVNLCRHLVKCDSTAHVAYLNGDLAPATLHSYGVMGLDYTAANYRNHPLWVAEAHKLGMTTNVWTIDDVPTMVEMADMGIDFVTTNNPVTATQIYEYYTANTNATGDNPAHCDEAKPNLLDLRFNADGTVEDLSPMHHHVSVVSSDNRTVPVEYVPELDSYAAHMQNTWGSAPSTYCRVDYTGNVDFMAALADGHTLETTFCVEYSGNIPNKEAKWFSSHQGGGTGFLISTTSGSRKNEITFLPNISTTGGSTWRWATSGIVPESGKYYHVIGVWNAQEEQAYIYVNGELCNKVPAQGSMIFPTGGATWFGIGCDPSGATGAEASANWHIVSTRIYDKALTPEEVEQLW